MTFDDFKRIVKEGLDTGEIKVFNPDGSSSDVMNSELSLAIQYSIGEEMVETDKPLSATAKELCLLILKHCGPDVYNRVFTEAADATH